jgi:hypothetical protein
MQSLAIRSASQDLSGSRLQAHRVHFRLLVDVVLPGVAQAILESPCFLGKGPDQAFSGRNRLRLAAENRVFKGEGGIDPLPPGCS